MSFAGGENGQKVSQNALLGGTLTDIRIVHVTAQLHNLLLEEVGLLAPLTLVNWTKAAV